MMRVSSSPNRSSSPACGLRAHTPICGVSTPKPSFITAWASRHLAAISAGRELPRHGAQGTVERRVNDAQPGARVRQLGLGQVEHHGEVVDAAQLGQQLGVARGRAGPAACSAALLSGAVTMPRELPGERPPRGEHDGLVRRAARCGRRPCPSGASSTSSDPTGRQGMRSGADGSRPNCEMVDTESISVDRRRRADQRDGAPHDFRVSQHDGPAALVHARIGPGADDDLGPDAGGVAQRDGQQRFLGGVGHGDSRRTRIRGAGECGGVRDDKLLKLSLREIARVHCGSPAATPVERGASISDGVEWNSSGRVTAP